MKKLIAASLAAAGLIAAAPASALVIGGIDFGTLDQGTHLETATLAQTYVNAVGQSAQGYGLITTVNGNANYCATGTCYLYYYFHDYTVTSFSPGAVQFDGGVVDIYIANGNAANLLADDSVANIALIQSFTPWVSLEGHEFVDGLPIFAGTQTLNGFGSLTGGTLTGFGAGQLDVIDGSGVAGVADYLDGNTIADNQGGFADIVITSSFNNFVLNPNDVAAGFADSCRTNPQAGEWCYQGTANLRGTVVPEPGSLALAGLGLLGAGAFALRNRKRG